MDGYDAIVVPGGGLQADGTLPPWVRNRLEKAAEAANGGYVITLSAGTPHKPPPLDKNGTPVSEAYAEAEYLMLLGHPPERILIENASYDTIGNAYFTRTMHTDPAGLRKLLVITSDFHAPRTEFLFRWVFNLPPVGREYELRFAPVPDVGMTGDVRTARMAKEKQSLSELPALAARYTTLASFHRWLFESHGAYRAGKNQSRAPVDELLLRSY